MAARVCCPSCWAWSELKTSMTCERCGVPLIFPDGRRVTDVAADLEQPTGPEAPSEPAAAAVRAQVPDEPAGWSVRTGDGARAQERTRTTVTEQQPPAPPEPVVVAPGDRLRALLSMWAGAVWNPSPDSAATTLSDGVVFEDARTGQEVSGRRDVLAVLQRWDAPPRCTRLELMECDDQVLVFSEAAPRPGAGASDGESYLVFSFTGLQVTRVQSLAARMV